MRYETKKYKISEKDIKEGKFQRLNNRRRICTKNVYSLLKLIVSGEGFETPLVVNVKGNKFRLIDGNHRFEAIERFLSDYENNGYEVTLHIYKGLTEEQERSVFRKWNLGKKQSADDYLQMHQVKIPLIKKLIDESPITLTIYASKTSLKVSKVCTAYLIGQNKNLTGSGIMIPSWDFVDKLRGFTNKDINAILKFLKAYVDIEDSPRDHPLRYTSVFQSSMYIWMKNGQKASMLKDCAETLKNSSVKKLKKLTGVGALRLVHSEMFKVLKKKHKNLR